MLFLTPNQQRESTKGPRWQIKLTTSQVKILHVRVNNSKSEIASFTYVLFKYYASCNHLLCGASGVP